MRRGGLSPLSASASSSASSSGSASHIVSLLSIITTHSPYLCYQTLTFYSFAIKHSLFIPLLSNTHLLFLCYQTLTFYSFAINHSLFIPLLSNTLFSFVCYQTLTFYSFVLKHSLFIPSFLTNTIQALDVAERELTRHRHSRSAHHRKLTHTLTLYSFLPSFPSLYIARLWTLRSAS
jgi:hypothetical protein